MTSSNGSIVYKSMHADFINRAAMSIAAIFLTAVIAAVTVLFVLYWESIPLFIIVILSILLVITAFGIIFMLLNGIFITKKGKLFFFPDFRIKVYKMFDVERLAINFNECENHRYSVTIKIKQKNGKFFFKDYSRQFRNLRQKKLSMFTYTIKRNEVDRIYSKFKALNNIRLTIINRNCEIVMQNTDCTSGVHHVQN